MQKVLALSKIMRILKELHFLTELSNIVKNENKIWLFFTGGGS